jgi:hypothetical protein
LIKNKIHLFVCCSLLIFLKSNRLT